MIAMIAIGVTSRRTEAKLSEFGKPIKSKLIIFPADVTLFRSRTFRHYEAGFFKGVALE